jgi:pre-rRNA-processing protein IPI1
MAKSNKAKKEKKKDFQKSKLKVGKSKPKSANFTDTSFKAKCKKRMICIHSGCTD